LLAGRLVYVGSDLGEWPEPERASSKCWAIFAPA